MCGRFTSLTSPTELLSIFATEPLSPGLFEGTNGEAFRPNFNVPPTSRIAAIAQDSKNQRRLGKFHWGLVPHWSSDTKGAARCINARSETILEKPSFRSSVPIKRCIIPMDGFYEWRTVGVATGRDAGPKQPVYVTRADQQILAIAGLWASWRDPALGDSSPWFHSCCVITTQANETMTPIHDRMPVILESKDWHEWLDVDSAARTGTPISRVIELMIPASGEILIPTAVSTAVNSVRNNSAELIVAIK